jgi:hypothetical protein
MSCGTQTLEDCPGPLFQHLYGGYWANVPKSLYAQYLHAPAASPKGKGRRACVWETGSRGRGRS